MLSGASVLDRLKIPFIYCWTAELIPKPDDWMQHIDVTGFLFLESPAYKPEPDLSRFLSAGPPPIYIGFGSIVVEDPARLTRECRASAVQTPLRSSTRFAEGAPSVAPFARSATGIHQVVRCAGTLVNWLEQNRRFRRTRQRFPARRLPSRLAVRGRKGIRSSHPRRSRDHRNCAQEQSSRCCR